MDKTNCYLLVQRIKISTGELKAIKKQ